MGLFFSKGASAGAKAAIKAETAASKLAKVGSVTADGGAALSRTSSRVLPETAAQTAAQTSAQTAAQTSARTLTAAEVANVKVGMKETVSANLHEVIDTMPGVTDDMITKAVDSTIPSLNKEIDKLAKAGKLGSDPNDMVKIAQRFSEKLIPNLKKAGAKLTKADEAKIASEVKDSVSQWSKAKSFIGENKWNIFFAALLTLPFFGITSFLNRGGGGGGGGGDGGDENAGDPYAMLCDTFGDSMCPVVSWMASLSFWGCCCCCILVLLIMITGGGGKKKAPNNMNF